MIEFTSIKCNNFINPIGIDRQPVFSWKFKSDQKNTYQVAYQIQVYDANNETYWNSGKTFSEDFSVYYAGKALESRGRYRYILYIWDSQGNQLESSSQYFEMGLLQLKDWKGKWIESDLPVRQSLPVDPKERDLAKIKAVYAGASSKLDLNPSIHFRKTFSIARDIRQARAYVTAHGIYQMHINGKIVSDELVPGFNTYDRMVEYQTYDITEQMNQGENVVGIILADGWYTGRVGLINVGYEYGESNAVLMQIEITYGDGTKNIIISDRSFKFSEGPYKYGDLSIGEKYDATCELTGWDNEGYSDQTWKNAIEKEYGYETLRAQYGPPVVVTQEISAVEVIKTPKNEWVIDFGQNIAGRIRMKVRGEKRTEIHLLHSEVLDAEGNFLQNIIGLNNEQEDVYILKGDEEEIYEPVFTFHGFRYVKVSGYPGTPEIADFTAMVLGSDCTLTGEFSCSDERITKLQQNIMWSQRANILSIPTDCPQRERAGWTGDIMVYVATACYNMDLSSFLRRWMDMVGAEQLPNGAVPIVVPFSKNYRRLAAETSAGWGDACVIVPWTLYQYYGDINILKENFEVMQKWMQYIKGEAKNNVPVGAEEGEQQRVLWNTGFHFGDWLYPSAKTSGISDMMLSASSTMEYVAPTMYAYSADCMYKICKVLEKKELADEYKMLKEEMKQAYSDIYIQEDGKIGSDVQGLYVLALQMNLVVEEKKEKVVKRLAELIKENGECLDTGFLSVPFLLDVLFQNGERELAYKLLFQTKCPSWLYEVENGATTIWESWDAILPDGTRTNRSYNHYAFGCVGDFLYKRIAGIKNSTAGYKDILIEPDLQCGLDWAAGAYESIYGKVVSSWKQKEKTCELEVEIPVNTGGEIILNGYLASNVFIGNISILEHEDIETVIETETAVHIKVNSGKYFFTILKR